MPKFRIGFGLPLTADVRPPLPLVFPDALPATGGALLSGILPWSLLALAAGALAWREWRGRRITAKLRESEARLRALVESVPFEFWMMDDSGRCSMPNTASVRRWGNARGKRVEEFDLPPHIIAQLAESHRQAFDGKVARKEMELPSKDKLCRYETVVAPMMDGGVIRGVLGLSIDVTEERRISEAKQKREGRFRALVENSAEAVALFSAEGEILYASSSSTRILGYPFPKFAGYNAFQFVHPDDRSFVAHQLRQSLNQPNAGVPLQARVHHHNGNWRLIEGTLTNLLGDPRVESVVFNYRDITERTMAQKALRESEARFQAFMDHSPAVIYMKDAAGRYLQINRQFEQVFGLPRAAIIGRKDDEIFSPALARQFCVNDRKTIGADRMLEFEETPLYVDGPRVTLVQRFPLHDGSGQVTAVCGISTDVTERRQLEQQLRQAQRMESIGQLAGGIAHDFNNLLTVIQGHASLIEETAGLSADVTDCLAQICAATEQASNLTRQLLAFSRRQTLRQRSVDLNEVVDGMTKMLRRTLGENIALLNHLCPAPPPVLADPGMIEQVLLNLAINARDAMPRGGRLVITTEQREPQLRESPAASGAAAGPCVCLSVSDTGSGIEPQHLPRIFEPFFTTKDVGKGTGLGLATVYGIVRQHRGWIDVSSEPGHGTTFEVFLPIAGSAAAAGESAKAPASAPGGSETVLIVEDEDPLRRIVRAILERHGYRVLEASSGTAALKVWAEARDTIDLVLTDMMMPDGIDGQGLASRLRAEKADVKILFTSGYSEETAGPGLSLREGINFIPKPYHPLKLVGIVRQALDSEEPPPAGASADE